MADDNGQMAVPRDGSVIAVVGAGDLVSHIHRREKTNDDCRYRYNVFRLQSNGNVTHALRAGDLPDLVKLSQVIAFAVIDDGWLSRRLREELIQLEQRLDRITRQWSQATDEI